MLHFQGMHYVPAREPSHNVCATVEGKTLCFQGIHSDSAQNPSCGSCLTIEGKTLQSTRALIEFLYENLHALPSQKQKSRFFAQLVHSLQSCKRTSEQCLHSSRSQDTVRDRIKLPCDNSHLVLLIINLDSILLAKVEITAQFKNKRVTNYTLSAKSVKQSLSITQSSSFSKWKNNKKGRKFNNKYYVLFNPLIFNNNDKILVNK